MRRTLLRTLAVTLAALTVLGVTVTGTGQACTNEQSCSGHYGVNEAYFGNGGALDTTCSSGPTGYCAQQSAGETAVGTTSSGGQYQAKAGFNTSREPSLTLVVNDASCPYDYQAGGVNIDLGYLNTGSTTHYNVNFSVKTYLANSYVVSTVGAAPVSNGPSPHTLLTPTGSATPGTEKFGINLVANTGFGHNMQPLPDATFSFGAAATGYNTGDSFKYTNGDIIAQSSSSSGTSCYDMSYVFDISSSTPAGVYTMHQSIVATSTY